MKTEDKVPDLELCQKLYKLGVTKGVETEKVYGSYFRKLENISGYTSYKLVNKDSFIESNNARGFKYKIIPAPDLLELLELLGPAYSTRIGFANRGICFNSDLRCQEWVESDNRPNATAKMLIKLVRNK